MEMGYLSPVETRASNYYNCSADSSGLHSPIEHIYEELIEPPALPPDRNWKYKNPTLKTGELSSSSVNNGYFEKIPLPSINENYIDEHHEGIKSERGRCCRHRKCLIIIFIVFLLSGVTLTGLLFHLFPQDNSKLGVAFSVFWPEIDGDASPAMTKVYFNKTYTAYPSMKVLPLSTSEFITPFTGVYLFSLSLFAGSDICSYRIENPVVPIILGRSSGNRVDGDTIGREMIVHLPAETRMHILKSGFIHNHDSYYLNSWSGFSLSSVLEHSAVIFSVARRTSWARKGPVDFDMDLVHGGSNLFKVNYFVAPRSGIYYFSASAGTSGSKTLQAHIAVDGNPLADLFRNSSWHDGPEILSRVAMATIEVGSKVTFELIQGTLYSSEIIRETSFMGFLYEPQHSAKRAWSLHDSRSYLGIGKYHLNPVPFSRVLVAQGVEVDNASRVKINDSGVYYVHLNAGVLPHKKLLLQLQLNARTVASIWRFSAAENGTGHDGYDTVGRSILLSLSSGDVLHLSAAGFADFGLGSTPNTLTSFTGFLLYPT